VNPVAVIRCGRRSEGIVGDEPPPRSARPELDDPERAMGWYNSPRYQAALQFTLRSAKTKMLILTGHSEG
jgi:uncharacterized protein (DUF1330 family)